MLRSILHSLLTIFHPLLPEKLFLQLLYLILLGNWPDLENPKKFSEKIQWLKLNSHDPQMVLMTDKLTAKQIAASLAGEQIIIPTLKRWKRVEDIDFDSLPDKFVIKTNNSAGGDTVAVCRDKTSFDTKECRKKISKALNSYIFDRYGEWQYKEIEPEIFAEQYMEDSHGELRDYKFFCFNGQPHFLKVDTGRFGSHEAHYLDMDWKPLSRGESKLPPRIGNIPDQPECFEEMKRLATTLSNGQPFIRIDLYAVEGRPYFGEFTFFPASGLGKLFPNDTDREWGKLFNRY